MRNLRWGILLGGVLLVVLGGLLLPMLNGMYVAAGHRQSAAGDRSQAQPSVPAQAAPAASATASTASGPNSVLPVVPAGQPEVTVPTLQILSPKAGEDVSAPFTVRFLISGVGAETLAQLNIRLTVGNPAFYTMMLPV